MSEVLHTGRLSLHSVLGLAEPVPRDINPQQWSLCRKIVSIAIVSYPDCLTLASLSVLNAL